MRSIHLVAATSLLVFLTPFVFALEPDDMRPSGTPSAHPTTGVAKDAESDTAGTQLADDWASDIRRDAAETQRHLRFGINVFNTVFTAIGIGIFGLVFLAFRNIWKNCRRNMQEESKVVQERYQEIMRLSMEGIQLQRDMLKLLEKIANK